jgi:hypothetical protein
MMVRSHMSFTLRARRGRRQFYQLEDDVVGVEVKDERHADNAVQDHESILSHGLEINLDADERTGIF